MARLRVMPTELVEIQSHFLDRIRRSLPHGERGHLDGVMAEWADNGFLNRESVNGFRSITESILLAKGGAGLGGRKRSIAELREFGELFSRISVLVNPEGTRGLTEEVAQLLVIHCREREDKLDPLEKLRDIANLVTEIGREGGSAEGALWLYGRTGNDIVKQAAKAFDDQTTKEIALDWDTLRRVTGGRAIGLEDVRNLGEIIRKGRRSLGERADISYLLEETLGELKEPHPLVEPKNIKQSAGIVIDAARGLDAQGLVNYTRHVSTLINELGIKTHETLAKACVGAAGLVRGDGRFATIGELTGSLRRELQSR